MSPGLNTGLISQNGDPPYAADNIQVVAHWLNDAPLRPAPIRSPGKPANCFAVESFVDELAAAAGVDPVDFRLRGLTDPRAIEAIKRVCRADDNGSRGLRPATTQPQASRAGAASPSCTTSTAKPTSAMAMEVAVERASGKIKVERVVCAQDCGQIINPDGARGQVEGSILQTLSRVLMEEVMFDRRARRQRRLGELSDHAILRCAASSTSR